MTTKTKPKTKAKALPDSMFKVMVKENPKALDFIKSKIGAKTKRDVINYALNHTASSFAATDMLELEGILEK